MQTVVGGAGFIGAAVCRELEVHGGDVTAVDQTAPPPTLHKTAWLSVDLLSDDFEPSPGRVILAHGSSMPRAVRPWTLVLSNVMTTARLARHLTDHDVVLMSSVEVYGSADGPLHEDTTAELPVDPEALRGYVDRVILAASHGPMSAANSYELCEELATMAASGRWTYGLSKLVQEELLRRCVSSDRLTILRLANVVGPGQYRFLGRMVENALNGRVSTVTDSVRSFVSVDDVARVTRDIHVPGVYNVACGSIALADVVTLVGSELHCDVPMRLVPAPQNDTCGLVDSVRIRDVTGPMEDVKETLRRSVRSLADDTGPVFSPPLPVVVPPRPERPDLVSHRMSAALWSGQLRGGAWTTKLVETLAERLELGPSDRLIPTCSGTAALRLAVATVAGQPEPGSVALCPAYTFHATSEVLAQLGWTVRLVDVDRDLWTMDPQRLAQALADPAVGVVVTVDALGNPSDYRRLVDVCQVAGVPLVADSAAAIGARYAGKPVGTQAAAHAFSMSFAKTVSAGGAGGAVVLRTDADVADPLNWLRSSHITELAAISALDNVTVVDTLMERRERVAEVYREAVEDLRGFEPQHSRVGDRHAWVHWATRVPEALGLHRLATELAASGVQTRPYYEVLQTPSTTATPVAAELHRQALALPMSSELSTDDADRVVMALRRVLRGAGRQTSPTSASRHRRTTEDP